jgi:signal transduction histidine kinase
MELFALQLQAAYSRLQQMGDGADGPPVPPSPLREAVDDLGSALQGLLNAQEEGRERLRALERQLGERTAERDEARRLYEQARQEAGQARHRVSFLAEASSLLASSLDFHTTLGNVARLAVPALADWCIVDLLEEDGSIRQLAVAHADPAKVDLAWQLDRRYPDNPLAQVGVPQVIRTGQAQLYPTIGDEVLVAVARDADHLEIVRALGLRSGMIVPLAARGRVLGAISLGSAESARTYGPEDLALAEDVGRRAGVAIDNARFYQDFKEADRRKDEFLAMLAHELRNPLAPIRNALQVLRLRGPEASTVQWAQELIERQVQHMARLVDDLLDVSRITRGKIELRKEWVRLAAVVEQTLESIRPLISAAGHQLEVSLPEAPLWLHADPTRLAQVLANLLHNAVKYTESGGRIWLAAELPSSDQDLPQELLLRVRDSGIGIRPDVLPKVFDLFVQGDRGLDRSQGGLGIGLTLVRSLVELHGGSVQAFSSGPGMGTEFVIRLPLPPQQGIDGYLSAGETVGAAARALRVLIVDDNHDAASSLAMLLRLWGHEVEIAHDGPTALDRARGRQAEVVLLDIGLPGMDGYEVARRLCEIAGMETVRLVAMTGYGQQDDRRRSREAGFENHLVKPVDPAELRQLLTQPARA